MKLKIILEVEAKSLEFKIDLLKEFIKLMHEADKLPESNIFDSIELIDVMEI